MRYVTQQDTESFLARFDAFNDCLFDRVEIVYEKAKPVRSISVWIEARDYAEKEKEVWVLIHLLIRGVGDYCISDRTKETNVVLSNGIHILWSGSLVSVDFGHFADQPDSMDELQESGVFVIGASLEWQVEPLINGDRIIGEKKT